MREEKSKKNCVALLQNCSSATHMKVSFEIPARAVAVQMPSFAIVEVVVERKIS